MVFDARDNMRLAFLRLRLILLPFITRCSGLWCECCSLIGLTVFASIMYFVELGTWTVNEDYPHGMYLTDPNFDDKHKEFQQPSTFTNIPRCFWFVLVTATTVRPDRVQGLGQPTFVFVFLRPNTCTPRLA